MNIFQKEKKYILQTYKRHPLYVTKAKGKYVWDHKGRRYLDFFSGLGVCNVGHCHRNVVAAIKKQAERLMHTSNLYYTLPQATLAEKLSQQSLGGKVFFSNSGTEANECAIKLARKNGGKNKWKIISFKNSFHGRTLAALSATGQKKFHVGFEPMPKGFIYAELNNIKSVKKKLDGKVCGILIEPVQGEGGVHVCEKSFLRNLRRICKQRNILLIFDEVQCGMGRTGKFFAYEHFGIKPDILTVAKSLGGGLPIGATITTQKVASLFTQGDHGSTFGGNPVVCSAGIAAIKLLTPSFLNHVARVGKYCIQKLQHLQKSKKSIKQIRGLGLMIGIELKNPGDSIVEKCQELGLLINCTQGNILRFLPPLDVTFKDVDTVVDIIADLI